jgi:hypothetical protein
MSYELQVNLRIVTLNGLSQLYRTKSIYLCGSNDDKQPANLLKLDFTSNPIKLSYLVTSCYNHIYPALVSVQNDFIALVGGRGTKKCEMYNKKLVKWTNLAELPEERFGCTLVADSSNNCIYLFGGLNENAKICYSVLKYSFKPGYYWETIITRQNSEIMGLMNCCVLRSDKNKIIFLGGANSEGESDRFIEYDLTNKNAKVLPYRLSEKARFSIFGCSIPNSSNAIFAFDDGDGIHKIQNDGSTCSVKNFYLSTNPIK